MKSPAGTFTRTFSPFFLPRSARPTGLSLLIRPSVGLRLGRADDRERLLAVLALDLDRRADLDVIGRVVLVDDRGVLDQGLEGLDPALDERLLVLGVLVLGVLERSPCSLASWIRWATSGRFTDVISSSSARSLSRPSFERYVGLVFIGSGASAAGVDGRETADRRRFR